MTRQQATVMAMASYRSKLLRFMVHRAYRLHHQARQGWRQLQSTVAWGIQWGTVTAYGCWQQVQQLTQGGGSPWRWLTSLSQILSPASLRFGGGALERILALAPADLAAASQEAAVISPLEVETVASDRPRPDSPSLFVQGIATDLATRRLAWVTAEAQFVVSAPTHARLQQCIEAELASDQRPHQRHLGGCLEQGSTGLHGALLLVWIRRAIHYFFGPGGHPNRLVGKQASTSGLSLPVQAVASMTDVVCSPQHLWRSDSSLGPWSIGVLIRQAIAHFFHRSGSGQLTTSADGVLSDQAVTLSLGVVPGLLVWGQSVVMWIRRTLNRWYGGLSVMPEPAMTSPSPEEMPSPHQALPRSHGTVMAGAGVMVAAAPVGVCQSTPTVCLEVPATVIGYQRSLLVWLLLALDWLLVRLERLAAQLWTGFKALITAIQN